MSSRGWIIALLLVLAGGIIISGFDAVGKAALIESALFRNDASLLHTAGVTQNAYRLLP